MLHITIKHSIHCDKNVLYMIFIAYHDLNMKILVIVQSISTIHQYMGYKGLVLFVKAG